MIAAGSEGYEPETRVPAPVDEAVEVAGWKTVMSRASIGAAHLS